MKEYSVILENIQLAIGNSQILNGLNLNVEKNCIHTIIGTTGSGKSLLLKLIAGMTKQSAGKREISAKKISFVFQEQAFFEWLTIRKNIELSSGLKLNTNSWLERFKLKSYLDYAPNALSGGTKQKFNLLRAFLNKPEIILLDEPFSHLDQIQKEDLYNFTIELWKDYKPTIILVTHDIDEAIYLSHTISFLSRHEKKLTENILIRSPEAQHTEDLASEKNKPNYATQFATIHAFYKKDQQ